MALIQCSECKCEISDQAQACPNCGAPRTITGEGGQQPPSVRAGGVHRVVLLVSLVLLVLAAYRVSVPLSKSRALWPAHGSRSIALAVMTDAPSLATIA